jgi:hypothetical protein
MFEEGVGAGILLGMAMGGGSPVPPTPTEDDWDTLIQAQHDAKTLVNGGYYRVVPALQSSGKFQSTLVQVPTPA